MFNTLQSSASEDDDEVQSPATQQSSRPPAHNQSKQPSRPAPQPQQRRNADDDSGVNAALSGIQLKQRAKQLRKAQKKKQARQEAATDSAESSSDDADATSSNAPENTAVEDDEQHREYDDLDELDEEVPAPLVTPAEVSTWLEDNGVRLRPSSTDRSTSLYPMLSMQELEDRQILPSAIIQQLLPRIKRPTTIQSVCWPYAIAGWDVVGVAHTGSGKTLAFLIPAVVQILKYKADHPDAQQLIPHTLVLAPTRELVQQIHGVIKPLNNTLPAVTSAAVYGGPDLENQGTFLRTNPSDLLVATPGRLVKLMQLTPPAADLAAVRLLILDEADRMLDLGFEHDLTTIVSHLKHQPQTLLFSATWPTHIQEVAAKIIRQNEKLVHVTIRATNKAQASNALPEELPTAAKNVQQIVEVINRKQGARERRLVQLMEQYHADGNNRIIIFVLYKREADHVADYLTRHGHKALALSGDKTQTQRQYAMQRFRDGSCSLLVATDVAARGIDVSDVTHVINFSVGLSIEHYIHRIGRTGRANAKGIAHTFVVDYDLPVTPALLRVLEWSNQPVPEELKELGYRAKRKQAKHATETADSKHGDAAFVRQSANDESDDDESDDADAPAAHQQQRRSALQKNKQRKGKHRGRPK